MMRIAMMNLVLHGIRKAHVKRANTLSDMGGLADEDMSRKYKVILSNPPFSGVLPSDSIRRDLPTNSKKSELLFLAVMMQSLAPGGICAVVVPEGLLFSSTVAHVELRKKLVDEFEVLAMVSLPAGVFKPYAGVKTGVLVFRRPLSNLPKDKKKSGRVWFYEIKADGYDPDKISGGGRPETPERNDIPDLLKQWKAYRKGGYKTPPGVEANTLLPAGSEEPHCWWARLDQIMENDYSLTAGRYKPLISHETPQEDPTDMIQEVLQLESAITHNLMLLLNELEIGE